MKLTDLPTSFLLAELSRRLQAASPIPSWALPAVRVVAEHEGITPEELLDNRSRSATCVFSRQLLMAVLVETSPRRSLVDIARLWKMHHGAALHARRKIACLVASGHSVATEWHSILAVLSAHGPCRTLPQGKLRHSSPVLPSPQTTPPPA